MSNNTPAKNGRRGDSVRRLVLAALFLALCMVLPFLTGGIPVIGNAISPMHIPVLICGFVCGWPYGLAVGFIFWLDGKCLYHAAALRHLRHAAPLSHRRGHGL